MYDIVKSWTSGFNLAAVGNGYSVLLSLYYEVYAMCSWKEEGFRAVGIYSIGSWEQERERGRGGVVILSRAARRVLSDSEAFTIVGRQAL